MNAGSLTADVVRERLPNGLTVLIKEIPAHPVVALSIWVKAGYFNERDDEVGISHVIEHMFFKGTRRRPGPDQIATEVKTLGGELNAGTYYDFTHYYFSLPAGALAQGLEIQSDALTDPRIDPAELAREIEAIIQEARRKLDNPSAFAAEKHNELAFRVHRIRRWRIGHEEVLRGFTREKLLNYYHRHYRPENIILSVAGDVKSEEVMAQSALRLGSLPPGDGRIEGSPPEPPAGEFRFRSLKGDIQRTHLFLGFRTVPLFHPDDLPIRILATLLGKGRSSRLFQEVKERRGLVDGIGAGTEVFADLGTLTLSAELDAEKLADTSSAIAEVLEGARRREPTEAEIQKARSAVESQYYFSQGDVLGVSSNLAYYEALGDYRLADEFVRQLQEVGPETILRCARAYLRPDEAALLVYRPEAGPEPPDEEAEMRRIFQRETLSSPAAPPGIPTSSRRSPPPSALSLRAEEPRRLPLPGGAVLVAEASPRLPVTNVVILFRGGRSHESPENTGMSRLALATMAKGTSRRDALQIAVEMESFGCSLERIFNDDYLGFSIGILSKYLPGGMDLLLDVIRNPVFSGEELDRERRVQRAAIEALPDQAMGYAYSLFREAAFSGHPYSLPTYGTIEVLDRIRPAALRSWWARIFRPERMIVAVVGSLGAESVREMLAERMAGWAPDGLPLSDPPTVSPREGISERADRRRRAQTVQVLGFPAPGLRSETKYPLDLLQNAVSGLGGLFFEAIRGRRGLAYVVSAMNFAKRLGGAFVVSLGTSPEKETEARRILMEEVERIRAEGIPEAEFLRSRAFTLGTYPMMLQTNQARALSYAAAEIQEKGWEEVKIYPDRIRAVAPEQLHEAARQFLTPGRYALGVVRGSPG